MTSCTKDRDGMVRLDCIDRDDGRSCRIPAEIERMTWIHARDDNQNRNEWEEVEQNGWNSTHREQRRKKGDMSTGKLPPRDGGSCEREDTSERDLLRGGASSVGKKESGKRECSVRAMIDSNGDGCHGRTGTERPHRRHPCSVLACVCGARRLSSRRDAGLSHGRR